MVIRVLIINRQLVFAVTIKQALEQTGAFEVHPFTDPNAAMEYLRTHPHEVALVDFAIKVMPGAEIVRRLREIQPEIAIIVSPMQNDSNKVIRDLSLQGMVDAPFSARGIIPLIEHAVEQQSQPSQAITRSFVEPDQPASTDTEVLSRSEPGKSRPRSRRDQPVETRILPDEEDQSVTRNLADFEVDDNLPQTRILRETARGDEPAQTRILPDPDADDEPQVIDPDYRTPAKTKILDDDYDFSPPPGLPEFSSLGNVLTDEAPSSLFEPPVRDGDTPAVPDVDSDAVRQFLATSSGSGDRSFDQMLGDIDAEDAASGPPRLPGGDFRELVDSMRAEQQYTPLPDRHQQFVEFILTGGMESLITEIEKSKTDTLEEPKTPEKTPPKEVPRKKPEPPPAASFAALLADEPPMPTLEEGGTVSDLMVGVSDTSFRNVLAMMRGEENLDEDTGEQRPAAPSRQEIEAAYAAFFEHEVARQDEDEPPALPEPAPEEPSITAQLILETALDESTPVDSFSLDYLIDNIERQLVEHKPEIQPLPSWKIKSFKKQPRIQSKPEEPKRRKGETETRRYVQEPDFLPEEFSETTSPPATEDAPPPEVLWEMMRKAEEGRAALDKALQIDEIHEETEPAGWDAPTLKPAVSPDWLGDDEIDEATVSGSGRDTAMTVPPSLPEEVFFDEEEAPPAPAWNQVADDWDAESAWDQETVVPAPSVPAFEGDWDLTIDEDLVDETVMMDRPGVRAQTLGAAADFEPQYAEFDVAEPDDPYIAQIALSLTQVSLELAAEATLLTSETEIVAFAGNLVDDEVEELRKAIADDWDANPNEARVRFITLTASGKDYMLYSRKTVNNFTLTMIFSGTTPLRDIRRQGRRLIEALESVPDVVMEVPPTMPELATMTGEVSAVEPEPAVTAQPFTYLWLLKNPDLTFNTRTARAIAAGLNLQLGELGWRVQTLRVQGEYVYLHADVPGERPAYEVIDDLKRRAAEIAHGQEPDLRPDTLWADSYLVMMPGRELDPDEIDQFITFERMA